MDIDDRAVVKRLCEKAFDLNELSSILYKELTHKQTSKDFKPYGYGVFEKCELIAMCSVGEIDHVDEEESELLNPDKEKLLLSDLYVVRRHRGKGVATHLVRYATTVNDNQNAQIIAVVIESQSERALRKAGFRPINESDWLFIK